MITKAANAVTVELPLQPFRVPGGWIVEHNELRQLEPSQLGADDPLWCFFTEDLLQLRAVRRELLLDVGWYPDSDASGSFRAVLLKAQDWDHPLQVCETRTLADLIQRIEEWLLRPETAS